MMGRAPCCDKANVKKGPWSPEEDAKLKDYIQNHHGTTSVGNWIALPQKAGLKRCGKSCRLRWLNYLRPNIKHGEFSEDEDRLICTLFANIGSRWSIIAAQLPGRTDNDIKNYWNTKLKKKLIMGMSLNQKNPHQTTTFPLPSTHNFLSQNHSMNSPCTTTPLLSQIPSPYEAGNANSYYSTLISPISVLQTHDTHVGSSMHDSYYNQVRDGSSDNINNLIMFGGERSSGSSEGSQIISCCKVEQDRSDNYHVEMSYFNNENHQNKVIMGYADHLEEKAAANNGCFISKNPMDDYSTIEEIKQLISTNSLCSNNLNFFVDEIKAQGKNQI